MGGDSDKPLTAEFEADIRWLERQKQTGHCGESTSDKIDRQRRSARIDRLIKAARSSLAGEVPAGSAQAIIKALREEHAEPIVGPEHDSWSRGRRAGLRDAIIIAKQTAALSSAPDALSFEPMPEMDGEMGLNVRALGVLSLSPDRGEDANTQVGK